MSNQPDTQSSSETAPGGPARIPNVAEVYWDNLGGGWRMDCLCGWTTVPCDELVGAAEEMELHWDLERSRG